MGLERPLRPSSIEHVVHHLLDHDFDLSLFYARYRNDQNRNDQSGASAYPPETLLKVFVCACAQGVVSSRGIWLLCGEIQPRKCAVQTKKKRRQQPLSGAADGCLDCTTLCAESLITPDFGCREQIGLSAGRVERTHRNGGVEIQYPLPFGFNRTD